MMVCLRFPAHSRTPVIRRHRRPKNVNESSVYSRQLDPCDGPVLLSALSEIFDEPAER
jgi:hypothetical protein